jgi:hypothetical protein
MIGDEDAEDDDLVDVDEELSELDLLLLENVKNLAAGSNLATCLNMLDKSGFCTTVFWLDPKLFGAPAARSRLWMVCLRRRKLRRLGVTDEEARGFVTHTMDQIAGSQISRIDEFLLAEDDPLVKSMYDELLSARAMADGGDQKAALLTGSLSALPRARRLSQASVWLSFRPSPVEHVHCLWGTCGLFIKAGELSCPFCGLVICWTTSNMFLPMIYPDKLAKFMLSCV